MEDDTFFFIIGLVILVAVNFGDGFLNKLFGFKILVAAWAGWTTSSWARLEALKRAHRRQIAAQVRRG